MTEPKSIIIGAGIAGLAAGIYGQMNGCRTEIWPLKAAAGLALRSWPALAVDWPSTSR